MTTVFVTGAFEKRQAISDYKRSLSLYSYHTKDVVQECNVSCIKSYEAKRY